LQHFAHASEITCINVLPKDEDRLLIETRAKFDLALKCDPPNLEPKKSNSSSLLAKAIAPASSSLESPFETKALTPFDIIRSSVNLS
jgi:hypothetical protein